MRRNNLVMVAILGGVTLGLLSVAARHPFGARAQTSPTSVSVQAAQPWTDTGVYVSTGSWVQLLASGTIYIAGSDPGKTPNGGGGSSCTSGNFVTSNAACWSLIGRFGNNAPFAVGTFGNVVAPNDGELYLGVNDDYFGDNSGQWTAIIQVAANAQGAANSSPPPGYDQFTKLVVDCAVGLIPQVGFPSQLMYYVANGDWSDLAQALFAPKWFNVAMNVQSCVDLARFIGVIGP